MRIDLLKALNAERAARRAVVQVTDIRAGTSRIVREAEAPGDPLAEEIGRALRAGKSGLLTVRETELFLNVEVPPARVVVIGAVHIGQALAPMARLAGLDVEIVDPRTAFATPERFPGVPLHADWPEDALKARPLDAYTALVAVTHDPKIDDMPLKAALDAGCFYVGALGSRKTHSKRLERLAEAGASQDQLSRIEAPIGLDIGAVSPAEIAVAVLGSIIRALRRRPFGAAS
ncbi:MULTISPECIES: XdhC family protein [unclassified Aureimonas]|uniref:XdhC family protein n=1 Tax=unclassified Aureimonas TaxID=2615206 RepID=UPI0006F36B72|nr:MULTISPECIES: XdhC family protein [unclassified Aureimonas]KQT57451.1 XdhC/CoxF family protein [Aureimonas sp. Leaf427]KQT77130.1 XdhC/CoxF family protein [Aureimonas sp. Leaf460]